MGTSSGGQSGGTAGVGAGATVDKPVTGGGSTTAAAAVRDSSLFRSCRSHSKRPLATTARWGALATPSISGPRHSSAPSAYTVSSSARGDQVSWRYRRTRAFAGTFATLLH